MSYDLSYIISSQIIETHEKQTNVTFSWAKATTIDIERYRTLTFELLKKINLLPAITWDDCNCKSAEHKLQIDQFYMQLCAVLEKASRYCIPSFTVDPFRDYTLARADYCAWRANGKPRSGPLCFAMKQSRLRFKSALRYCQVNEDDMRSNAFAKSLMDKDLNSFWRGIRKVNNAKIPLASTVENCVDELSICDMWKTHYESLLNSVQSCDLKTEISNKTDHSIQTITECTRKFSIASITNLFKYLKGGKASGVDGLAAEHFLYADRHIYVYLSLLFNSFMYHGYLPAEFMKTAIVPIIKCKTGNSSDKNNY